jgi:hypothetical protein
VVYSMEISMLDGLQCGRAQGWGDDDIEGLELGMLAAATEPRRERRGDGSATMGA